MPCAPSGTKVHVKKGLLGTDGTNGREGGVSRTSVRISGCVERLENYNFDEECKAGETNLVADLLSRLPLGEQFVITDPVEQVVAALELESEPLEWNRLASLRV